MTEAQTIINPTVKIKYKNKMNWIQSSSLIVFLSFLCSAPLYAIDPHSVNLGAGKLTPRLTVTSVTDSNIYLSNDDIETNQDSQITIVNPSFDFHAKDESREFFSNFSVISGTYSDTRAGEDDYMDYKFSIGSKVPIINRQTIHLHAGRDLLHDNRGAAFTAGIASTVDEPDEYQLDNFGIKYNLGDNKSKMRLDLAFKHLDKEYTNNETTTGTRNYNSSEIDGKFTYRTQSKIETFLQVSNTEIDYKVDNPVFGLTVQTFDGSQNSAYVGLAWKATAKTSGTVKAGSTNKKFDDPLVEDISNTDSWLVDLTYTPTQRAIITLGSSASLFENEGTGSAKESQSYSAAWKQTWPRRISSFLSYGLTNDIHSDTDREDDTTSISANLTYNFRRWMDIRIGHTAVNRESADVNFEYDKKLYEISLITSL